MGGEKKKAFAVEFFGENQQMATRQDISYYFFSLVYHNQRMERTKYEKKNRN